METDSKCDSDPSPRGRSNDDDNNDPSGNPTPPTADATKQDDSGDSSDSSSSSDSDDNSDANQETDPNHPHDESEDSPKDARSDAHDQSRGVEEQDTDVIVTEPLEVGVDFHYGTVFASSHCAKKMINNVKACRKVLMLRTNF
nr:hypothetical protein Iba_chr09aCG14330 [Ipomoea batatas]